MAGPDAGRIPSHHALRWAAGAAVVVVAGFLLALATTALGPRGTVVLDDVTCVLVPAAAGLLGLHRARRERACGGSGRTGWLLLGGSCLSWAAGGAAWTVYEVGLGREVPFPSLADVGYLAAAPAAAAGVLLLSGTGGLHRRVRDLADGAIAGTALLFVSWMTVLGPVVRDGEGSVLARAMALGYPLGDVLVATAALLAVARARGGHRTVLLLLGCGLTLFAVSDAAFAWFTAQGAYATGNLLDAGYVAGYALVALAAVHAGRQDRDGGTRSPVSRAADGVAAAAAMTADDDEAAEPGRLARVAPYLPAVLVGVVGVALDLPNRPLGAFAFWDALLMMTLLFGRQLISVSANAELSRRLKAMVVALEERERELAHRAFHDDLTGLPNRARFHQALAERLASDDPAPVTVLLIDLDDFKLVNDGHGHHVGDALLVDIAQRLRAAVPDPGVVARLGGDEFAVLVPGPADDLDAHALALRIADHLADPLRLANEVIPIQASIGIAGPRAASDVETLLLEADAAMYRAKRRRKGTSPSGSQPW